VKRLTVPNPVLGNENVKGGAVGLSLDGEALVGMLKFNDGAGVGVVITGGSG
jgi:hypothetical protein